MQVRTPQMKWLASLLRAPEVSLEQQADRIRFMERDVCLTIKVVVVGALGYIFLSDWFEGVSTIGELGTETVRGAFRGYAIANILIGLALLAMDYLPVLIVQWAVFVLNIVDGMFVALLIVITGGLESTIYWVFLVLVIRNAVSIARVRLQIVVNLFIVLCYLLAGLLDLTMLELKQPQEQFEQAIAMQGEQVREINQIRRALMNLERQIRDETQPAKQQELVVKKADLMAKLHSKLPAKETVPSAEKPKPVVGSAKAKLTIWKEDGEQLDTGRAAFLACYNLFEQSRASQAVLSRLLLLLLLAIACYGINVLADLQLQVQEEAREFAVRQEQLRSTGRLAAEIAHQLKNPLAIINNAAFSLQKSLGDAKPAAFQQVEMIREEVARSDRILTELMGYAQLAEGRVERLDVRLEVDQALQRAFPPALQHEVLINVACLQTMPPLLMQRAHLHEVLVNLLTNARDAMNQKGRLDINIRQDDRNAVIIRIADTGPGIPEHQREHIFDPYYSTKEKGTGLGLAIVRHNTEIYGGKVTVESTLGKGTAFTLVFPAKTTMTAKA